MNKLSKNVHLQKEDIIKNGSIYTPDYIVDLVFKMVKPYITKDMVIADFGSGYGSFMNKFNELPNICFATEYDEKSYHFLKYQFDNEVFLENSLLDIKRSKYNLCDEDDLVIIGNPPYNDVTSLYKKGQKGKIECDRDVLSRDMGMSFMKTYCKLNAKYICILHPLSYLIKRQNFKLLGFFKEHYKLLDATIFSSKNFESIKKTNSEFPVIAALYERDDMGMEFDYINTFKFKILNSKKTFCLNEIKTVDGIVQKYPHKGEKSQLQFYTLRDMNSLLRNTSFTDSNTTNGISFDISNLYQYCWLYFLKMNFNPKKNKFLYGNLSPLYFDELEKKEYKNAVVSYAYNNCPLLSKYMVKKDIEKEYGKLTDNYDILYDKLEKLYVF